MKTSKIYYLFSAIIILLVIFYFYQKYNVAPRIDMNTIAVINENNEPVDFTQYKGKKVIISFYASWCPNCLDELKTLNQLYSSKLSDITILCITDEPMDKLISFRDKKQYPFTFLKLTKSFPEIGINSIPTTYLLNTNNQMVYENVGYIEWDDESTLNHLKTLMN